MMADDMTGADTLRRLRDVERSSTDTAAAMGAHVATCLEQHRAIGVRFDGVDGRLDQISKQLINQNRMVFLGFGLLLMGEVFGWKQALAAGLHLFGVAP